MFFAVGFMPLLGSSLIYTYYLYIITVQGVNPIVAVINLNRRSELSLGEENHDRQCHRHDAQHLCLDRKHKCSVAGWDSTPHSTLSRTPSTVQLGQYWM